MAFFHGEVGKSQMEYVDFVDYHIPKGKFQWFIYIISYLQIIIGDTVSKVESNRYVFHVSKVCNTNKHSIIISKFNIDIPPIF